MYISPKSFGIMNIAGLDGAPHAAESLLAHIINRVRVHAAGAQGYFQALAKIGNKMRFRRRISGSKATQVFFIERKEVHWLLHPVYFSLDTGLPFSPGRSRTERSVDDR